MHYRWHPLHGRRVRRHYSERRAGDQFVHVEAEPGVVIVVAAWMLDPVACAGMAIGAALSALIDLHHLLIERGSRRSSLDDPIIVQEEDDVVPANTIAADAGPTPAQHGARLRKASGNEPGRARDGTRPAGQPAAGSRRSRGGGA